MKHNHPYRYYEVSQDLINFLRKEDKYQNFSHNADNQVYSHYGEYKKHSDKYIGIIIEFQNEKYFAPLTHDGKKNWFSRGECCDFEKIYDGYNKYVGSILLCKALPLTRNLVKSLPLRVIFENDGMQYGKLCNDELTFLNSQKIHNKIQDKMQQCVHGVESPCKTFRVNFTLASRNVAEYNAMLLEQAQKKIEKLEHNQNQENSRKQGNSLDYLTDGKQQENISKQEQEETRKEDGEDKR